MELPKQVLTSTDWLLKLSCGSVKTRFYPMSKTISKLPQCGKWDIKRVQVFLFLANISIIFVAEKMISKSYTET